jgi:anti-anti-sigma factor
MMTVDQQVRVLVYRDGAAVHARLLGPLNQQTAPQVERQLDAALAEPCAAVTLDLGAADYVDSDGVRWIQRYHGDLAPRALELRIAVREGSRVERTLKLLKLDSALRIDRYPAEPAARGNAA